MALSTKSIVARDVEQAQRDVADATIFFKEALARSNSLLNGHKGLVNRSRAQIANFRDRFKPADSSQRRMFEQQWEQTKRHVALGNT
jgi:hypothetical protein